MSDRPPFEGIRILDMATIIAGPWASGILADQGAEVIKVEAPPGGDGLRVVGSSKNGISNAFHLTNRGKRSIAVDLKHPDGLEVLRRLIKTADVLVHNMRPGVMDRLGFGYDAVRALRDDIIYVSISGFGDKGPLSQSPTYDPVIQCFTGMAWRQGGQGGGKPNLINNLIVDKITSLTAAQAISAALYARKDGRGGQHVKLSLMAAAAIFSWLDQSSTESFLDPDVKIAPSPADFSRLYQFSDGWATILPNSDAAFLRMCRAFGVTEVEDPALQTFLQRRNDPEGGARVTASLEAKLAQVPISEGMARLAAIDVPCAPVMTLTEMATHPHSAANELFADNQYPLFGRVREARPAAQFSGTPARIGGPAPTLGQDTDSLLAELGMDAAALRAAKAVR